MKQGSKFAGEVQIVAFKLGEEEFAVDLHQVHEVLKLVPVTPLPDLNYTCQNSPGGSNSGPGRIFFLTRGILPGTF